ncbi:hypothetical protein Vi05172_g4672 [Venturia inaequalis]|nr:hypothetical protein Vi05172_g4672 [Venturia inaequalis]
MAPLSYLHYSSSHSFHFFITRDCQIDRLATLTGIKGTFVDGVDGKDVPEKALPPNYGEYVMPAGNRGSWRAHLNAIQRIVTENLESALIVEDDVDWDIRIKSQLHHFADAVQVLTQPLASDREEVRPEDVYIGPESPAPRTLKPETSPYGDNWDMLWLGHCGVRFPEKEKDGHLPRNRVLFKDETVPSSQHISLQFGTDELVKRYANHTRAVHHTAETVCSLAYAITQRSARQILYDIGLKELRGPYDIMLREYCDGIGGRKVRNCYTAQPQYFQHHRPAGSKRKNSDINSDEEGEEEFNQHAHTYNIRWSTRLNMQRLVDGETEFEDQWPDDAPASNRTY